MYKVQVKKEVLENGYGQNKDIHCHKALSRSPRLCEIESGISHRKLRCAGTALEKSQEKSACLGPLRREPKTHI